jgi:carotenoid cleavage dioxygenase-like enzyme
MPSWINQPFSELHECSSDAINLDAKVDDIVSGGPFPTRFTLDLVSGDSSEQRLLPAGSCFADFPVVSSAFLGHKQRYSYLVGSEGGSSFERCAPWVSVWY